MQKKQLIILIAFMLLINKSEQCFSQSKLPESPEERIKTAKQDSNKVNLLIEFGTQLKNVGDYNGALHQANEAIALSQNINYVRGEAKANELSGDIEEKKSNYQEAIKKYTASLNLYQKINDKRGMGNEYAKLGNTLGNPYGNMSNYPERQSGSKRKRRSGDVFCREVN